MVLKNRYEEDVMERNLVLSLVVLAVAMTAAAQDDGWVSLFDGKTLEGWIQKNGKATYRVEDGAIVGKTEKGSPNSFLCTTNHYGDFELKLEVKVDDELNSGVQIRSNSLHDYRDYRDYRV